MSGSQRGRPRSVRAHQAILESTRELLAAGGYEKLTIEAIAARAGVAKQTLYRWWPSKAAVVAEAVMQGQLLSPPPPVPDTGDLAADLGSWLTDLFQRSLEPAVVAIVRALAAAAADNDTDAARLYDEVTGPVRQQLLGRLAVGARLGQIRAGADLGAAADMVMGASLYRTLAGAPGAVGDDPRGIADVLLHGLTTGAAASAPIRPAPAAVAPRSASNGR